MKELAEIVAAWDAVCREGREALLATVVRVSGSTYRRPGARMLLTPEGRLAGSVSGGCLEGDILKRAWWHTEGGPALVTYDSTDADDDIVWGFGLGCNGVVQVLLERVSPAHPGPLDLLSAVLNQRRPGAVATVIGAEGLPPETGLGRRFLLRPDGTAEAQDIDADFAARLHTDVAALLGEGAARMQKTYPVGADTADVFWEVIQPPMPLVVFGAGHDALPLVRLAKELGWHVSVVDTRSAQPRPARFPGADAVLACSPEDAARSIGIDARTAAVVMTHNYPDDRRVLQTLLLSPAAFIGQLGPRARTERLLAELSDGGLSLSGAQMGRLHGPVGLDIGADNPEEIALSIIAEIQAAQAGRTGGPLRDRQQPLHPHAAGSLPAQGTTTERPSCLLSAS